MDFIEQLFGLSPDNGDGSTEILWLAVLAIGLATIVYFRIQRQRARQAQVAGKKRL
jgi:hypothetical protein